MFYRYENQPQEIAFAVINENLVLRIYIKSEARKSRLSLPEINFIRKTTFDKDYGSQGDFYHNRIRRITEKRFQELLSEVNQNIQLILKPILKNR